MLLPEDLVSEWVNEHHIEESPSWTTDLSSSSHTSSVTVVIVSMSQVELSSTAAFQPSSSSDAASGHQYLSRPVVSYQC